MYRYGVRFRLKLTATLLQKLATFYMWNGKQKDEGMDQNTRRCCYGDYVTMNQQTEVHAGGILHSHHATLFSKTCQILISYWVSLRSVKVSRIEV